MARDSTFNDTSLVVDSNGRGGALPRGRSAPQPGRVAKRISLNEVPQRVGQKQMHTVGGLRPAALPANPPVASASRASQPVERAAVAPSNPGTPALSSLFDTWPWSTMGRVFVGRTDNYNTSLSRGSGVLVGRRVLLTASHVVPWELVSSGDWWVRFVPAYFNGTARYGDSYVAGWYGFHTDDVEGDDYVACALYEPLGDQCGWLGVTSLTDSRYDDFVYSSVGYPAAVQHGEVPCMENGLTIQDIDDEGSGAKELETRLFGGAGWSGGPLFSTIDGGTLVVGVRSGRETDFLSRRRVVHAGGRKLVDIVRHVQREWEHLKGSAVLTYNQANGQFAIGDLQGDGSFASMFVSGPGAFSPWTQVTGGGNGALLFYNQANGQFATGLLTADGLYQHVFASDPGAFSPWTHLVSGGKGTILTYNQANRQFATGRLQADGSFDTLFVSEAGAFSHWTHITGAGNGALLFYNQANGQFATGVFTADGRYQHVFDSEPGAFSPWTHIVSGGGGTILTYNQANGQFATGRLQADGSFDTLFVSELGAFSHWTHITGGGNGTLLFYNQANGQFATGFFTADGLYHHVFASDPGAFAAWTHVVGQFG